MDILEGLNPAQRQAVTTTEGYVRVIAGAGSGKTRTLAHRFAFLVEELGILPGNILCVTFTNKSANEMRQRIHSLTGDNDTGFINTFHGFCAAVLEEDCNAVQYPKSFLVLDNSDIDAMLQIIYEERGLTLRDMVFSKARDMIEIRKLQKEPEYYVGLIEMSLDLLREKYLAATDASDIIFYGYLYQQKKCFGLDYNDLIKFTLYIFEKNAEIREKWQKRLEYIMIDEFQDIDGLQYQLMEALCGYHRNLFIVGDPDQTIYTWRGADVRYLLHFDRVFPNVQTVFLLENYRSTPQVLAAADSLIACNRTRMEKHLIPTLPDGCPVRCRLAENAEAEAAWLVEQIASLREAGTGFGEIAVLYRAHYVTRTIEEAFLRAKLPYTIYSGVQFWARREIKDALSYLRMIAYRDDLSFLRIVNVPKRMIGRRRIQFLQDYAAKNGCSLYEALSRTLEDETFRGTKAAQFRALIERFSEGYADRPVSEVLAALLDESGYERMLRTEGAQDRLDNLAELKQSVYAFETSCGEEVTLEHYLAHTALFTNADAAENGDKLRLMTVHAAKGLEFPYVFLCGMNEGVFPSRKIYTLPGMEEERRLAYVAMTRAEKGLFLSAAEGYNFDGTPRFPSRFLLEIGKGLVEFTPEPKETLLREAQEYADRSARLLEAAGEERFPIGQRVRHFIFGEGTVEAVDSEAYLVQFDGLDTTRRISFRVKLESC